LEGGSPSYNTLYGLNAGASLSSDGTENVLIGYQAGYNNSSGGGNVYVGYTAGYNNIDYNNVFIGTYAGYHNTSGSYSSFIEAISYGTPGIGNAAAIGARARSLSEN
jgi:hypothetical protein